MTEAILRNNKMDTAKISAAPAKVWPKSDWYTIILHWISAFAMTLSLFTGMRIASDALDAVVPKWFLPILPQGDMWTVHFWSALSYVFAATAYLVYLRAGDLFGRNSPAKLRILKLKAPIKMKWGAVNVALHWLLYAIVLTMITTGIFMYQGYGGWIITIHRWSAITAIGYIFAHIIAHYMYGGWLQLLRIFLPQSLKLGGVATAKPVWLSLLVAIPVTGALAAVDWGTRDQLVATALRAPLDMTKLLADPAWAAAKPVFIHTAQGANLGGGGESLVEIRALHDAEKIYFAFRWEDPTRSVARLPMIKQTDGWHMLGNAADKMDVTDMYEDKFSVIFTQSDAFGDGGIAHLGIQPVDGKPKAMNERGLHYTTDGTYIEMWQWKATRGGVLGYMDHQYMGPPRDPTPGEAAGKDRYQGGYWNYDGGAPYIYNYVSEPPGGYKGPVVVKYLPKDLTAMIAAENGPVTHAEDQVREDQQYWMYIEDTIPYSKEADDKIPIGTILPGVVLKDRGAYTGKRGAVRVVPKWADGHWTMIASRDMKKDDKIDQDMTPGAHMNMYVAVYDHTQTRHTRHQRPVRLTVK